MKKMTEIDFHTENNKTSEENDLLFEKHYSYYEVEKWTKKFLDAKRLKQKTVMVFGIPRQVRPPFQECYIVSRYYGPAKTIPLVYRAEEMFPSSEGIPQL